MNNSGIYGGDRRQQVLRDAAHKGAVAGGFADDPEPTSFVPKAKYAFSSMLQFGVRQLGRMQCVSPIVSFVHSTSR